MKSTLRNKIIAGVMAIAMLITTWIPAEKVKADDSVLPAATNTTFATARELPFNMSIAEDLSPSDNSRYYKFTLSTASELTIGVSREWITELLIYDAQKTQVYADTWYSNYQFSTTIYLTGGQYYLQCKSDDDLSFVASANSLEESIVETQDVNNDMVSSASPIALKTKYKGVLAQNDEVDYYQFTVPSAGRINYNMTNSTNGELKYVIYDSSMNSSFIATISAGGKASDYISLAKGNYYLAITKGDNRWGVGSYNFSIDYVANTITAPKIKSVKNTGKKKMTVKWSKVTGVDGYELQYSTSSTFKKSVTKKKVSKSKSSVSYSKLKKGKKYYVRMRSYAVEDGVKKYSKWSGKKSVKINK